MLGEARDLDAPRRRGEDLQPVYHGTFPTWSACRPVTNLWNTNYVYGYFQTSRGCPHRCTFCSVHEFFGGKVRIRPIDEVVTEVAASKRRLFWGIDDNIWGVNVNRSIELYAEMARNVRGKWWFGSGDLTSVQHPRSHELLTMPAKPASRPCWWGGNRTTSRASRNTRL